MSFVLLGILNSQAAAGGFTYWLSLLGGASDEIGRGVVGDNSGNFYIAGQSNSSGAGSTDFLLASYNSVGEIQWQKTLGGASSDIGESTVIDSSDNLYYFGHTESSGQGNRDFLLAKYNNSGTIQWQRTLGGGSDEISKSVAIDSSSNIYVSGHTDSSGSGSYDFLFAKYNSSGTLQWQRTLGGAGFDIGGGIAVDSGNNLCAVGRTASAGEGGYDFSVAKINSSGTLQWQRTLGDTGGDEGQAVAVDSSDNIYAFGQTTSTGAGSADWLLAKYNSSGTIQWQRVLGGTGFDFATSVAVDSNNNVYVSGRLNTVSGSLDIGIAKYDSSGTLQWQRTLGSTGTEQAFGITINSDDDICVVGYTDQAGAGGNDVLLAKLPNDGSLTGTYQLDGVDFVYAASSFTNSTSSLTDNSSSLSFSTPSLTSATSSLTSSTSSLTSETIGIG